MFSISVQVQFNDLLELFIQLNRGNCIYQRHNTSIILASYITRKEQLLLLNCFNKICPRYSRFEQLTESSEGQGHLRSFVTVIFN